jgi:hypothetical protein
VKRGEPVVREHLALRVQEAEVSVVERRRRPEARLDIETPVGHEEQRVRDLFEGSAIAVQRRVALCPLEDDDQVVRDAGAKLPVRVDEYLDWPQTERLPHEKSDANLGVRHLEPTRLDYSSCCSVAPCPTWLAIQAQDRKSCL